MRRPKVRRWAKLLRPLPMRKSYVLLKVVSVRSARPLLKKLLWFVKTDLGGTLGSQLAIWGAAPAWTFHEPEEAACEMALEAALDLAWALAFDGASSDVGLRFGVMHLPRDDDRMQGPVELAIAGAGSGDGE